MGDLVVIGDFSLERKNRGYTPIAECAHKHLSLDDTGDVVRCADCKTQVSAYWALTMLADEYNRQWKRLQSSRQALENAKAKEIHLLAAQRVEKAWRSRTMVPSCPHCLRGIFPQDGFGNGMVNKEIENRRRRIAAGTETQQS